MDLNVLIVGKVRSEETVRGYVATCQDWLRAGQVKRVVFSGWLSDEQAYPELFVDMARSGVEIVLSPEPRIVTDGNMLQQTRSLNYGLSLFDDEEFVLKLRTDKIRLDFDPTRLLNSYRSRADTPEGATMSSRIVIHSALCFQPFFFCDMTFAGLAKDLQKLVSSDLWFDADQCSIKAEQFFFTAPYLERYPEIREYFSVNPGLIFHDRVGAIKLQHLLLDSQLYLRVLGASLLVLRDEFMFWKDVFGPDSPLQEGAAPVSLSLRQIADGAEFPGGRMHQDVNSPEITDREGLNALLSASTDENGGLTAVDVQRQAGRRAGRSGRLRMGDDADMLARALSEGFPNQPSMPRPKEARDGWTRYPPRVSLLKALLP